MKRVAIGFRVKSGRAIAVAMTGSANQPSPVARVEVALCDPRAPETRQPYHHGFFTHETDAGVIAKRLKVIERSAKQSVASLIASLDDAAGGRRIRAALVVGSLIDPATVANPHIRAHASEGKVFRTVLVSALASHGVACEIIVEKQLSARASAAIGRPAARIARAVATLGDSLGGPWRADDKAAATAALIALASC